MKRQSLDLCGVWRFQPDPGNEGERAGYARPRYDVRLWREARLPATFDRCHPGLEAYEGAAWFRPAKGIRGPALIGRRGAVSLHAGDLTPLEVLLDGEEEQGSPTLAAMLDQYGSLLDADLMLFCDGPMHQSRRAQLVFGVRGDIGVDVTAYGASRPLHSGHYGGPGLNPLREISRVISTLHDEETGAVKVPGFYEGVHEISDDLRRQWEGCGFDEADYLGSVGYTRAHGETAYSTLELGKLALLAFTGFRALQLLR